MSGEPMIVARTRKALAGFMLAFSLPVFVGPAAQAAYFGRNDVRPVISGSQTPIGIRARSTAVAVLSANISELPSGNLKLDNDIVTAAICKGETFEQDPSLSWACSGFLVAPDLIVTAGHCMVNTGEDRHETETYCQAFSWLFDYQADASGKTQLSEISPSRHYHCKQVVYAVNESKPPYRDFAIVQLDRPVTDRAPLKLSAEAPVGTMSIIGYPLGTPVKSATGGRLLLNNISRQSFITTLDAFDGNSGSAVFNSAGSVIGILTGGSPTENWYADKSADGKACVRLNHCDEKGENCTDKDDLSSLPAFQRTGSEVQRIAPVLEEIKKFQSGN
jgi:V8-like Glu-specific endopeptidase